VRHGLQGGTRGNGTSDDAPQRAEDLGRLAAFSQPRSKQACTIWHTPDFGLPSPRTSFDATDSCLKSVLAFRQGTDLQSHPSCGGHRLAHDPDVSRRRQAHASPPALRRARTWFGPLSRPARMLVGPVRLATYRIRHCGTNLSTFVPISVLQGTPWAYRQPGTTDGHHPAGWRREASLCGGRPGGETTSRSCVVPSRAVAPPLGRPAAAGL
jgi:hypothetical protein